MTMTDDRPSVRVDLVDAGYSGSSTSSPEPPGSPWRRNGVLLAALLIVGGALAFFSGAPERADDLGFDEEPVNRQTLPTAPAPTGETETVTRLEFGSADYIAEIVAAPLGFIGLDLAREPGATTPTVWRSTNGRNWDRVQTTVDGFDTAEADGRVSVHYYGLERTAEGFAMFAVRHSFDPETTANVATVVRLQSDHGAAWRIDETFGSIDGRSSYVFSLGEERYGIFRGADSDATLGPLLTSYVPTAAGVRVCHIEKLGDQLRVFPCDEPGPIVAEFDDVTADVDPDSLFRCIVALHDSGVWMPFGLLAMSDPAQSGSQVLADRTPAARPAMLADGTVLVVAMASAPDRPAECDGIDVDLPPTLPMQLLVHRPGSASPEAHDVPIDIAERLDHVGLWQSPPGVGEDSMVFVGADAVWRVHTDGTWTQVIELPTRGEGWRHDNVSSDGRVVVSSRAGAIYLYWLGDGRTVIAQHRIPLDETLQPGALVAQIVVGDETTSDSGRVLPVEVIVTDHDSLTHIETQLVTGG